MGGEGARERTSGSQRMRLAAPRSALPEVRRPPLPRARARVSHHRRVPPWRARPGTELTVSRCQAARRHQWGGSGCLPGKDAIYKEELS